MTVTTVITIRIPMIINIDSVLRCDIVAAANGAMKYSTCGELSPHQKSQVMLPATVARDQGSVTSQGSLISQGSVTSQRSLISQGSVTSQESLISQGSVTSQKSITSQGSVISLCQSWLLHNSYRYQSSLVSGYKPQRQEDWDTTGLMLIVIWGLIVAQFAVNFTIE